MVNNIYNKIKMNKLKLFFKKLLDKVFKKPQKVVTTPPKKKRGRPRKNK